MRSLILVFVVGLSISSTVFAGIRSLQPLPSLRLKPWIKQSSVEIECRMLADIPGAIICLTGSTSESSGMVGRASYFIEGTPRRLIVAESDEQYKNSAQAEYAGHDILGKDLDAFYRGAGAKCLQDPKFCLSSLEQEARNTINELSRGNRQFAVIVTDNVGAELTLFTLSHELCHARFFLNSKYQKIVANYWDKLVSDSEKKQIEQLLIEQHYNIENAEGHFIKLNEFQAYLFQNNAETGLLKEFVATHAGPLRKALGNLAPAQSLH